MSVQEFLSGLERVSKKGDGWSARCPAHEDETNSLKVGIGDDGKILLNCFAGCEPERIVAARGWKMRDLFSDTETGARGRYPKRGIASTSRKQLEHSNGSVKGLTLEQYANAKQLPTAFLCDLGIREFYYFGKLALRIPYFGPDGAEVSVRFRLELNKSEHADNRFQWKKGAQLCLYGLWRIEEARQADYAILVEGESDCHTHWYHGFPAFGIPGANNWKEERDAIHFDGISTIYVVIEPDRGGQAVRDWLAASTIRSRVRLINLGEHKDPSAFYIADPESFKERWEAVLNEAAPWSEIAKAEQNNEAESAYAVAKDLLHNSQLFDRIGEMMRARGYAGDLNPPKLAYVAMTSRLLERPLNLAFVAQSASGKNRAVDAARELVPLEAVYLEKAGSARALIYADENFQHRTIIVAEADSIPEDGSAASAVRSLAEDNLMTYDVVEKNGQTGQFETRRIEKPGPTGLITTSTRSLSHQLGTRMLEVPLPDSPGQTREIMRAHARSVLPAIATPSDPSSFLSLQRWLALAGVHQVIVPFAEALADLVPAQAVRMRRDFRQLLTCIQSIALLHQCQRTCTSDGQIQATIADYQIARSLLSPIFETLASEGLTPAIRETVETIQIGEEVTEAQLGQRLGLAKASVSYRVKRAIQGGWLANNEIRKGHPAKLVRGSPLPERATALPEPEQLREVFECSNEFEQDEIPPSPTIDAENHSATRSNDREVLYI